MKPVHPQTLPQPAGKPVPPTGDTSISAPHASTDRIVPPNRACPQDRPTGPPGKHRTRSEGLPERSAAICVPRERPREACEEEDPRPEFHRMLSPKGSSPFFSFHKKIKKLVKTTCNAKRFWYNFYFQNSKMLQGRMLPKGLLSYNEQRATRNAKKERLHAH